MRERVWRGIFYAFGMVVLALGITLNTKTGLGVSPIISVPTSVANLQGWNLGNMTLILYSLLVVLQKLLLGRQFPLRSWLQLPVTVLFSRFINLFNDRIPVIENDLPAQLGLLAIAILLIGVGMVFSLYMDLIPNPGDGIVYALCQRFCWDLGLAKNVVDLSCVAISCGYTLLASGRVQYIGIGTLLTMLLVGRVVALLGRFLRKPLRRKAGLVC